MLFPLVVRYFPNLKVNYLFRKMSSKIGRQNRLEGKVAVITASTQGIGYAIAKRLGQEGAKIVVSSRQPKHVKSATSELQRGNIEVLGIPCNVTKPEERTRLIDGTVEKFGKIDILVSNAGTNLSFGPLFDCEEKIWDKIFDVNVKSAFYLVREILPHLKKSGNGRIVFVSSITGFTPFPAIGVYSVTKTALLGLTKAAAGELALDGITVNAIAPGIIKTKFSSALTDNDAIADQIISTTPMRRFGQSEEIAGAVAFLVSDDASYITGETIVVAGGMPSRL